MNGLLAVLFACLLFAGAANAALIVSPANPDGFAQTVGDELNQMLAVSFTLDTAIDAQIRVFNLQNLGTGDFNMHFNLISGSLTAPPFAGGFAMDLNIAPGTAADTLLNFGPLSLGAGTWFLVASATGQTGAWLEGFGTPLTEIGGTVGPQSFINFGDGEWIESDMALGFQVSDVPDGGLEEVPEPGTWLLMGVGLLAVGVLRRRRA